MTGTYSYIDYIQSPFTSDIGYNTAGPLLIYQKYDFHIGCASLPFERACLEPFSLQKIARIQSY